MSMGFIHSSRALKQTYRKVKLGMCILIYSMNTLMNIVMLV